MNAIINAMEMSHASKSYKLMKAADIFLKQDKQKAWLWVYNDSHQSLFK